MKSKSLLISLLLGLVAYQLKCQDFQFIWTVEPSFTHSDYTATIESQHGLGLLTLTKSISKESDTLKIDSSQINRLRTFLENYNFPSRGSSRIISTKRHYAETNFITQDSSWVTINRDTFRTENAGILGGYDFDPSIGKFYNSSYSEQSWTDGTHFRGRYITASNEESFGLFSARFKKTDCQLNELMLDLVLTYSDTNQYQELIEEIRYTKPLEEE